MVSTNSFLARFLPGQLVLVATGDVETLTELANAALAESTAKLIVPIATAFNELTSIVSARLRQWRERCEASDLIGWTLDEESTVASAEWSDPAIGSRLSAYRHRSCSTP